MTFFNLHLFIVIIRGINQQVLFEEKADYLSFLTLTPASAGHKARYVPINSRDAANASQAILKTMIPYMSARTRVTVPEFMRALAIGSRLFIPEKADRYPGAEASGFYRRMSNIYI